MASKERRGRKKMVFLIIIGLFILFILFEGLFVLLNGKATIVPEVSREPKMLGSGKPLTYVVLGDSTAAGQGGDYSKGIAVTTAQHLAKKNAVTFVNFAVSGATSKDVETQQLPKALGYKPDVVLMSVTANDVTHLTSYSSIVDSLRTTTRKLVEANCKVKIILTGSPAMGSVPRFPQPLRYFEGVRARTLNKHIDKMVAEEQLTRVPLAEKTGELFAKSQKEYLAADNFHATTAGYNLWSSVIIPSIDQAMATQPDHC